MSGRPLISTAASGGRDSACSRRATSVRKAAVSPRALACKATAGPAAAIAAARMPRSGWENNSALVYACTRANGLIRAADPVTLHGLGPTRPPEPGRARQAEPPVLLRHLVRQPPPAVLPLREPFQAPPFQAPPGRQTT